MNLRFLGTFALLFGLAGVRPVAAATPVRLNDPLPLGKRIRVYDISPQGGHVIYFADGLTNQGIELFSVPVEGGTPLRLSAHLGSGGSVLFHNAKISPDGTRVVYSARQSANEFPKALSIPVTGGTPVELGGLEPSAYYQISEDSGSVYYFSKRSGLNLFEFNQTALVSGERTQSAIHVGPNVTLTDFAISPDGESLVFRRYDTGIGVWELWRMALPQGTPIRLHGDAGSGTSVQDYRIDLRSRYVIHRMYRANPSVWELYAAPIEGGVPIKLNDDLPAGGVVHSWDISSDGHWIVFSAGPELGPHEIYAVPIEGGTPSKLHGALAPNRSARLHVISPFGNRVVFTADLADSGDGLYSVPVDGGVPQELSDPLSLPGEVSFVGLNRDGSRVVYKASMATEEGQEIFSVPIVGGARVVLSADLPGSAGVGEARITKDGRRVVYRVNYDSEPRWELYSVPVEGGSPVLLTGALTNASADEVDLSFALSPDSSRVIYLADQTTLGRYELYSVPLTGDFPESYVDFGSIHGLITPSDGDEDGDGLVNLLEYALGLDPRVPTTGCPCLTDRIDDVASHRFQFWQPAAGARDLHVDIESTVNLGHWEVLATRTGSGSWSGSVNVVSVPDGADRVVVSVTRPFEPPGMRFYRLSARLLPQD